jgi:hypothetical protein
MWPHEAVLPCAASAAGNGAVREFQSASQVLMSLLLGAARKVRPLDHVCRDGDDGCAPQPGSLEQAGFPKCGRVSDADFDLLVALRRIGPANTCWQVFGPAPNPSLSFFQGINAPQHQATTSRVQIAALSLYHAARLDSRTCRTTCFSRAGSSPECRDRQDGGGWMWRFVGSTTGWVSRDSGAR